MSNYTKEELELAVKCCLSDSTKWEETCGKCPLNRNKDKDNMIVDTNCLDNLIKALHAKLTPIGKWILVNIDDNDMPIYKCSICNTKRFGRDYYCGHCGAEME